VPGWQMGTVISRAVDGLFLNHSDSLANFEDLTDIPPGPTGIEAWPDMLVCLIRGPVHLDCADSRSGDWNGSELALARDLSFVSRGKAVLSQWEVSIGMVAGEGPMAHLQRLIGRQRALELLLSAVDIDGAEAERLG